METVFTTLTKSDLQDLIAETVNACLKRNQPQQPAQQMDQLLTVEGAAEYLHLGVPTIYGLISKGAIPYMKQSKRVYFSRQDLMHYLRSGRKKTVQEIEAETDNYLANKKGGKAK